MSPSNQSISTACVDGLITIQTTATKTQREPGKETLGKEISAVYTRLFLPAIGLNEMLKFFRVKRINYSMNG